MNEELETRAELIEKARVVEAAYRSNDIHIAELVGRLADALRIPETLGDIAEELQRWKDTGITMASVEYSAARVYYEEVERRAKLAEMVDSMRKKGGES